MPLTCIVMYAYGITGQHSDETVPEVCMSDWSGSGTDRQTHKVYCDIVTNIQTNIGQVTIKLLCYNVTAPYIM